MGYAISIAYLREMYKTSMISRTRRVAYSGIRFREGVYYFGTNKFYLYKTEVFWPESSGFIDLYSEYSLSGMFPVNWFAFWDWCLYRENLAKQFYLWFAHYVRHGYFLPLSFRRFIGLVMRTYPILEKEFPMFVIYCNRFVALSRNGGIKYETREKPFDPNLFVKIFDLGPLKSVTEFEVMFQKVIVDLKEDGDNK